MRAGVEKVDVLGWKSIIRIAVANLLINIGIGGAKDATNNNILQAVKNATPSDNIIKQTVRRAQKL